MIVSEQLNYIKTRRFHAVFMPVLIEFSRCIGTYSSAKFELVIDTDKIYVYYDKKRMIKEVFEFDDIESNDDIANLRVIIINLLDYS